LAIHIDKTYIVLPCACSIRMHLPRCAVYSVGDVQTFSVTVSFIHTVGVV